MFFAVSYYTIVTVSGESEAYMIVHVLRVNPNVFLCLYIG